MVTIATLTEKKQTLTQQRDQAVANVHAINGALQMLEQLIAQADETLTTAVPNEDPTP